jgi:flagellar biosynthesis/type III secretory pathway protein FliH
MDNIFDPSRIRMPRSSQDMAAMLRIAYRLGFKDGNDLGYRDGYQDGYDDGYQDGYNDGLYDG